MNEFGLSPKALRTPISTEELPSLRLVLTSTVLKLGLSSAPIPVEIKEPVELVILLISDDLICSESSALTLRENPSDIAKTALSTVFVRFEFNILIPYVLIKIDFSISYSIHIIIACIYIALF
jgi:hypothetical protein